MKIPLYIEVDEDDSNMCSESCPFITIGCKYADCRLFNTELVCLDKPVTWQYERAFACINRFFVEDVNG